MEREKTNGDVPPFRNGESGAGNEESEEGEEGASQEEVEAAES